MYMWAHLQMAGQVGCRPKVNVPSLKDQQPLLPWTYEMMQNPLTQKISRSLYSGSCCLRLPDWFCTKADYFILINLFFLWAKEQKYSSWILCDGGRDAIAFISCCRCYTRGVAAAQCVREHCRNSETQLPGKKVLILDVENWKWPLISGVSFVPGVCFLHVTVAASPHLTSPHPTTLWL